MKFRLTSDMLTAILFVGLGLFAILHSLQYPLGSASRMGPGYFPKIIGGGLLIVGAMLGVKAISEAGETIKLPPLRPLFFVLFGTISFGVLIEGSGIILAGAVLVLLARCATNEFRPAEIGILSAAVVSAIILIFVYGLGIRIPIFPSW